MGARKPGIKRWAELGRASGTGILELFELLESSASVFLRAGLGFRFSERRTQQCCCRGFSLAAFLGAGACGSSSSLLHQQRRLEVLKTGCVDAAHSMHGLDGSTT